LLHVVGVQRFCLQIGGIEHDKRAKSLLQMDTPVARCSQLDAGELRAGGSEPAKSCELATQALLSVLC